MKLKTLISFCLATDTDFLPKKTIDTDFHFLTDYRNTSKKVDSYFRLKKGNKDLINEDYDEMTISDAFNDLKMEIISILYAHENDLDRLYDLTKSEYNPLWNVDGTETQTNVYGKRKETIKNDERNTTNDYGLFEIENTKGKQTDKTITDDKETNVTNSVSGYNSSVLSTQDKQKTEINAYTDEFESGSRTDTTKNKSHQDTIILEETTDTRENDSYTDILELVRGGNIGVTKTQELIESDKSLWENFNFYDVLINLICKYICNMVWE